MFMFQFFFKLMRLKCEAYATLNDQDEDLDAEKHLYGRMGGTPPSTALVAPAALYLTAVLECICELVVIIAFVIELYAYPLPPP
jgi:hypothetical protein